MKLKALLQSAEATNEVLRSLVHAPHENQAAAWRAFTQHATATAHLIKSLESNRHGGDTGGVPGRDQVCVWELFDLDLCAESLLTMHSCGRRAAVWHTGAGVAASWHISAG